LAGVECQVEAPVLGPGQLGRERGPVEQGPDAAVVVADAEVVHVAEVPVGQVGQDHAVLGGGDDLDGAPRDGRGQGRVDPGVRAEGGGGGGGGGEGGGLDGAGGGRGVRRSRGTRVRRRRTPRVRRPGRRVRPV